LKISRRDSVGLREREAVNSRQMEERRMKTEATSSPDEGGNDSGETPAADEFRAITSQEDLNRVLDDRLKRERSKYADYGDLKAKATKLDEIENANRTEAERAQARISELETQVQAERLGAVRFQIAAEYGLNEKASGALAHIASEEGMREMAEAFKAQSEDRVRSGNHVPREGATSSAKPNDEREAVRELFAS
jgi:hypothetical protein